MSLVKILNQDGKVIHMTFGAQAPADPSVQDVGEAGGKMEIIQARSTQRW